MGCSWLSHTKSGKSKWPKRVGLDLWELGETVEVPEPASMGLMGLVCWVLCIPVREEMAFSHRAKQLVLKAR